MSKLKWVLLAILGLVLVQGYRITRDAGVFANVESVPYGECRKMQGPPSSEDITIDQDAGVAFISSGNAIEVFEQYRTGHDRPVSSGDIWLLDLNDPVSEAIRLNVDIGAPFHPHGIDLLTLADGARELYVINHPTLDTHEILIFSIADNHVLELRRRIQYPELISPNDIRAIAQDQFLVTNDHGNARSSWLFAVEDYLGLPWSSVSYFDGEAGHFAIKGLRSANGITLSADQQTLYVAEATARRLKRFSRQGDYMKWKREETLFVDTAVDNLEWDGEGHLLVGAHINLFKFLDHIRDIETDAPSHVIRVNVRQTPMTYETIFMSDGADLSASSVGARFGDTLLIGAVLETHFLRCSKAAS